MNIARTAFVAIVVLTGALAAGSAHAQTLSKYSPKYPTTYPSSSQSSNAPEACFFTAVDLKQSSFCVRGERRGKVEKIFRGRIQSISLAHNAELRVCDEPMLRGNCLDLSATKKRLPDAWLNKVRSFRIR